jgi:hypothetical protein
MKALKTEAFSRISLVRLAAVATASFALTIGIAEPAFATLPSIEWKRQFGTSKDDFGSDVAVDVFGNAYISGYTKGNLFGPTPLLENAFISKYDSAGNRLWAYQFGPGNDDGRAISTDGSGNVYVAGQTHGDFGQANAGHYDNFVIKYNTNGSVLWTKQWGSPTWDAINAMSGDESGNVFVSGQTLGSLAGTNAGKDDAFISKLDAAGNILWSRQFGTPGDDIAKGIATDGMGNAYVTGYTEGNLFAGLGGIRDAFVMKYDPLGNVLWSRQFGSSGSDLAEGVRVDQAGNTYIAGSTSGSLVGSNQGDYDAFLRKYDSDGNELWTRQLGTIGPESGQSVAIDNQQHVLLLGTTTGAIGSPNIGSDDIFVSSFTASGDPVWNYQFGSSGSDVAYNIATDSIGRLYLAGATNGSLAGPNSGLADAILVKLDPVSSAADYNGDGTVDAADFIIWRHNMGTSGPQGDGTGWDATHFTAEPDGVVDIHDYEFWRANFGATYSVAIGGTYTVPEPLNVHLFLFGIVMMIGQFGSDRLVRRKNATRRYCKYFRICLPTMPHDQTQHHRNQRRGD